MIKMRKWLITALIACCLTQTAHAYSDYNKTIERVGSQNGVTYVAFVGGYAHWVGGEGGSATPVNCLYGVMYVINSSNDATTAR